MCTNKEFVPNLFIIPKILKNAPTILENVPAILENVPSIENVPKILKNVPKILKYVLVFKSCILGIPGVVGSIYM